MAKRKPVDDAGGVDWGEDPVVNVTLRGSWKCVHLPSPSILPAPSAFLLRVKRQERRRGRWWGVNMSRRGRLRGLVAAVDSVAGTAVDGRCSGTARQREVAVTVTVTATATVTVTGMVAMLVVVMICCGGHAMFAEEGTMGGTSMVHDACSCRHWRVGSLVVFGRPWRVCTTHTARTERAIIIKKEGGGAGGHGPVFRT
jgi:hypothetical protein